MSKADFEYMLNKKLRLARFIMQLLMVNSFVTAAIIVGLGLILVGSLIKKIKKINQANGGFHHEPCQECLNYKLQQQDINYIRLCYNRKRGIK